jgi:hypothetical protein
MLYKNKNIVAKLKNQNGGLIQDGDSIPKNLIFRLSIKKIKLHIRFKKKNVISFSRAFL